MSNLNVINDEYYIKVFEYFKKVYVSNIIKKRALNFQEIISLTITDIGITTNDFFGIEVIESWFKNVNDLYYLEKPYRHWTTPILYTLLLGTLLHILENFGIHGKFFIYIGKLLLFIIIILLIIIIINYYILEQWMKN